MGQMCKTILCPRANFYPQPSGSLCLVQYSVKACVTGPYFLPPQSRLIPPHSIRLWLKQYTTYHSTFPIRFSPHQNAALALPFFSFLFTPPRKVSQGTAVRRVPLELPADRTMRLTALITVGDFLSHRHRERGVTRK